MSRTGALADIKGHFKTKRHILISLNERRTRLWSLPAGARHPVNTADALNWDERSGWCAACLHRLTALRTLSACKVGRSIYLGIICLQVHNVLNIQRRGESGACLRRRDCSSWNNFATSPADNTFREDKLNFCRFPLAPRSAALVREKK